MTDRTGARLDTGVRVAVIAVRETPRSAPSRLRVDKIGCATEHFDELSSVNLLAWMYVSDR